MALVACAFLALQTTQADLILQDRFKRYADIVVLFTAVAIPAHMVERSNGSKLPAPLLGSAVLVAVVTWLTRRSLVAELPAGLSSGAVSLGSTLGRDIDETRRTVGYKLGLRDIAIDHRLLWVGVATLAAFIVTHVVWD